MKNANLLMKNIIRTFQFSLRAVSARARDGMLFVKLPNMRLIIFILTGYFLFSGCSGTKPQISPDDLMVFPSPPDEPRIQFLTSLSSSADIEQFSKLDKFLFGQSLARQIKIIDKPYGLALGGDKLYICDTKEVKIDIIDFREDTFTEFRPRGRGTLRKPVNIVLDKDENIYIADTERMQVVKFNSDLKFLEAIAAKNMKPVDMVVRGDSLLIADIDSRFIRIWSIKNHKMIANFPPDNNNLPDSVRVFVPYSVDLDNQGNIYITDFGQFRIQKFNKNGEFIKSIGGIGRAPGQFARPKGIAIDRDNRLYAVDAAFENVQIFDSDGNLLMFFGGPYNEPGNMYLPAQVLLDYNHNELFSDYVIDGYAIEYLIFVSNQFGPDKISIYGFLEQAAEISGR